jgi:hypothetical protein
MRTVKMNVYGQTRRKVNEIDPEGSNQVKSLSLPLRLHQVHRAVLRVLPGVCQGR